MIKEITKRGLSKGFSIVKRIKCFFSKKLINTLYAPKNVLVGNGSKLERIIHIQIEEIPYVIAQINNGRIYTNRISNISVISERNLVPLVSWQYQDEKVLPDSENFLFKGKLLISRPQKKINANLVSLVTGGGGNYNYYHWLFDSLPRLYLAQKFLNLGDNTKYLIPEDTHSFQKETLKILGITKSSYISSENFQHIRATSLIATSHPNPNPSIIPKWIFNYLRESFLEKSENLKKNYIYVSRGDSVNSRRLLNEDMLIDALKPIGFEIYTLSELSFSEQVSLFSQAKIIVGVHGAGFANLTFASKGTVVYELFSEQYQPNVYESISRLGELDYNKIVCKADNSENNAQKSDLYISEDNIMNIIKHAESIIKM